MTFFGTWKCHTGSRPLGRRSSTNKVCGEADSQHEFWEVSPEGIMQKGLVEYTNVRPGPPSSNPDRWKPTIFPATNTTTVCPLGSVARPSPFGKLQWWPSCIAPRRTPRLAGNDRPHVVLEPPEDLQLVRIAKQYSFSPCTGADNSKSKKGTKETFAYPATWNLPSARVTLFGLFQNRKRHPS